MKLFLDKQLNTNDKETAIIAILNGMYSKKYDHLSTSVSLIGYEMTGKFLKSSNRKERTIIEGIRDAIQSLVDKEIIEIIDKNNDNYIFSSKGFATIPVFHVLTVVSISFPFGFFKWIEGLTRICCPHRIHLANLQLKTPSIKMPYITEVSESVLLCPHYNPQA